MRLESENTKYFFFYFYRDASSFYLIFPIDQITLYYENGFSHDISLNKRSKHYQK